MFGILKEVVNFVLVFYVLSSIILYIFQRNLIYFPTTFIPHEFNTETFMIEDEKINVISLNKNKQNAILYFGGNAEAVIYNAAAFIQTFPEHTIYLVNYRGYGGSTGSPSEQALFNDAQFIYDELIKKHDSISVIGRSLGSGIATYLASKRQIKKLILITPFDSIQKVAQGRFPIYPMRFLLKDKYNSISQIKNIKAKTLILLAQHDEIIPLKNSQTLINEFPKEQVLVKTILNSGHNDLSQDQKYYLELSDFMLKDE